MSSEADLTLTVTVAREFASAHRLSSPERGADWNERTYGPCCRPHGHGHNYVIEVTVSGRRDLASGLLIDARDLQRIVDRTIVDACDQKNLNEDVDFLKGINPTAEILVERFADRLVGGVRPAVLEAVVLHETPKNRAAWLRRGSE